MLKLCGTFAGIDRQEVPNGGDPFTRTTVKLRTAEGRTLFAQTSRDFPEGQLPAEGVPVELLVWPRPYVKKAAGELGCGFTAYGVAQVPSLV